MGYRYNNTYDINFNFHTFHHRKIQNLKLKYL